MSVLIADTTPRTSIRRAKYVPVSELSTLNRRTLRERRRYSSIKAEQIVSRLGLKLSLLGIVASWVFLLSELSK